MLNTLVAGWDKDRMTHVPVLVAQANLQKLITRIGWDKALRREPAAPPKSLNNQIMTKMWLFLKWSNNSTVVILKVKRNRRVLVIRFLKLTTRIQMLLMSKIVTRHIKMILRTNQLKTIKILIRCHLRNFSKVLLSKRMRCNKNQMNSLHLKLFNHQLMILSLENPLHRKLSKIYLIEDRVCRISLNRMFATLWFQDQTKILEDQAFITQITTTIAKIHCQVVGVFLRILIIGWHGLSNSSNNRGIHHLFIVAVVIILMLHQWLVELPWIQVHQPIN